MSQPQTGRNHPDPEPRLKPNCPKCENINFREERIRTTGDGWSRFFNLQNMRFAARICTFCGYTELYHRDSSVAGNVLDALFGT